MDQPTDPKPLVKLSIAHYENLLRYANENSPLYFRLKNGLKTDGTVSILCDAKEAKMLRSVAKHFWASALPEIEKAIRLAHLIKRRSSTRGSGSMREAGGKIISGGGTNPHRPSRRLS